MYCIAVCDDDPRAAEENQITVCRILDGRGLLRGRDYEVDVFHAPSPLKERLEKDRSAYDLLLLDIQIDAENGVDLARFLREHRVSAAIIYITDHPGFAMDSFPTYPLEYLLKPADEGRLAAALDWDLRRLQPQERPLLRTGTGAVPLEDILYLEISGRKTALHTAEEQFVLSEPLSSLREELLANGFYHTHFSYLVNLAHVRRVERTAAVLDNGREVPVSRRYYQALMDRYIDHLK